MYVIGPRVAVHEGKEVIKYWLKSWRLPLNISSAKEILTKFLLCESTNPEGQRESRDFYDNQIT